MQRVRDVAAGQVVGSRGRRRPKFGAQLIRPRYTSAVKEILAPLMPLADSPEHLQQMVKADPALKARLQKAMLRDSRFRHALNQEVGRVRHKKNAILRSAWRRLKRSTLIHSKANWSYLRHSSRGSAPCRVVRHASHGPPGRPRPADDDLPHPDVVGRQLAFTGAAVNHDGAPGLWPARHHQDGRKPHHPLGIRGRGPLGSINDPPGSSEPSHGGTSAENSGGPTTN